MQSTAIGWEFEVQRVPGWLLIRLVSKAAPDESEKSLAEQLRQISLCHSVYRVILELSTLDTIDNSLLQELLDFKRFIERHNGMLRLCGLSDKNVQNLKVHAAETCLPHYCNRIDAITGCHPRKPR